MLNAIRNRIGSFLPSRRSDVRRLDGRVDNVEAAHHRDLDELRALIDERAFAMAQVATSVVESTMAARMDTLVRDAASAARHHAEAAADAAAQHHVGAALRTTRAEGEARIARIRTELRRLEGTLSDMRTTPSSTATEPGDAPTPGVAEAVDEFLYLAIEDRFRGDSTLIRDRQARYVEVVAEVADEDHPVLDLGCGGGDFLALLDQHGVPARGIDSNRAGISECQAAGLNAEVGDLVEVLQGCGDGTIGAVTMFHVVEHLPFRLLDLVTREAARVLRPGGVLVMETPNALNLRVAATNFWLDPTHVRPLHPELLRLLAERAGFARFEDLFLHDIGHPVQFSTGDEVLDGWLNDLSRSLDGPGDFALLAWMPPAE